MTTRQKPGGIDPQRNLGERINCPECDQQADGAMRYDPVSEKNCAGWQCPHCGWEGMFDLYMPPVPWWAKEPNLVIEATGIDARGITLMELISDLTQRDRYVRACRSFLVFPADTLEHIDREDHLNSRWTGAEVIR